MPTPSTRTPVRIARGSYSNLNSSISDLGDGEIVYAEDQDKLYVKEGSSLVVLTQPAASPTFTGTVTVPTPTAGDNSTKAASTAFVVASFATKASPTFTGTVVVPTATAGDNSTAAASTAFVVASFANLASPTFTGTPTLPTGTVAVTQSAGNSTTAIATTAFVATSFAPLASPTLTGTPAAPTASANTNTTQIATTAFVMTELGDYLLTATAASTYAPLAAPAFTGTATGVNLTLSGNLTVNGTTTTIDTTNLDVEDKNITLGKVSTPTDTTADGGGITLKGATDKTFNWVDATDAWTSSEHIHLGDSKKIYFGTGTDLQIWHSGTNGVIRNTTSGALYIQNQISDISLEAEDNILFKNYDGQTYARFLEDGACELYWDDTKKLETTTAGVTVSGTVTDTKGELRNIPQNTQGSAYTLVAADHGKHILASGNITIPADVFQTGDAVTIINNSGSDITIISGTGVTNYNTADAATGTRTLASRGMATVLFASAGANITTYISGAGLS